MFFAHFPFEHYLSQSRIIIFKRHTTLVWRDILITIEGYAYNHCDDDDEFDKPNLQCISLSACTSLANSGFINRVATFISSLLTEYFDAMEEIVSETNGTILEYVGDAILAVWNAPLELKNHAEDTSHF